MPALFAKPSSFGDGVRLISFAYGRLKMVFAAHAGHNCPEQDL